METCVSQKKTLCSCGSHLIHGADGLHLIHGADGSHLINGADGSHLIHGADYSEFVECTSSVSASHGK